MFVTDLNLYTEEFYILCTKTDLFLKDLTVSVPIQSVLYLVNIIRTVTHLFMMHLYDLHSHFL